MSSLRARMNDMEFEEIDNEEEVDWDDKDDEAQELTLGGEGSGHHGHAGRPGEVGGSAPSGAGGGVKGKIAQTPDGLSGRQKRAFQSMAKRMPGASSEKVSRCVAAVEEYTTSEVSDDPSMADVDMNRILRGRSGRKPPGYQALYAGISAQKPIEPGSVVFRGRREPSDGLLRMLQKPGTVIRDKGFMSTSSRKDVARGFGMVSKGGVLFELKDKRGLGRRIPPTLTIWPEDEVVYPPGSRIRVRSCKKLKSGGWRVRGDIL